MRLLPVLLAVVACSNDYEIEGSLPPVDDQGTVLDPTTDPGTQGTPPWETTGGDDTLIGRDPDEPPPEFGDEDCPDGIQATWIGGEVVAMSWEPPGWATLQVPAEGIYDVYDLVIAESGPAQSNESAYLRISSLTNPTGLPEIGNCGDDHVVPDSDNAAPIAPGTTQYLGTFLLGAGDNHVEVNHYCGAYRSGSCPQFHDPSTTPCDQSGVNSVHITGGAVCLVPVL